MFNCNSVKLFPIYLSAPPPSWQAIELKDNLRSLLSTVRAKVDDNTTFKMVFYDNFETRLLAHVSLIERA